MYPLQSWEQENETETERHHTGSSTTWERASDKSRNKISWSKLVRLWRLGQRTKEGSPKEGVLWYIHSSGSEILRTKEIYKSNVFLDTFAH